MLFGQVEPFLLKHEILKYFLVQHWATGLKIIPLPKFNGHRILSWSWLTHKISMCVFLVKSPVPFCYTMSNHEKVLVFIPQKGSPSFRHVFSWKFFIPELFQPPTPAISMGLSRLISMRVSENGVGNLYLQYSHSIKIMMSHWTWSVSPNFQGEIRHKIAPYLMILRATPLL